MNRKVKIGLVGILLLSIMIPAAISVSNGAGNDDSNGLVNSGNNAVAISPQQIQQDQKVIDIYIVLNSKDIQGMIDDIAELEKIGLKATHRFPYNTIIGEIPTANLQTLKNSKNVLFVKTVDREQNIKNAISESKTSMTSNITPIVDESAIIDKSAQKYGQSADIAGFIWDQNYATTNIENIDAIAKDSNVSKMLKEKAITEKSKDSDALIPEYPKSSISIPTSDGGRRDIRQTSIIQPKPYGAGFYDTSEYMMGNIVVSIIFPESNGVKDPNLQNWNRDQEYDAVAHVQSAFDWWAKTEPRARLTFTYDQPHYDVPTAYESYLHPIDGPIDSNTLWTEDVIKNLGYGKYGDAFLDIRDYDNAIRDKYISDWAFSLFIVKIPTFCGSECFGGHDGFAYFGGPYSFVTYRPNQWWFPWPFQRETKVAARHEIGHIFFATDEYNNIIEYSGYLNQKDNDNSGCIMDGSNSFAVFDIFWNTCISEGSQLQIGWRDSNTNSIFDILDLSPKITLTKKSSKKVGTNLYDVKFVLKTSTTDTYPNNNPMEIGSIRNDITINRVSLIIINIDGKEYQKIYPQIGTYLDIRTLDIMLTKGTHTVVTFVYSTNGLSNKVTNIIKVR